MLPDPARLTLGELRIVTEVVNRMAARRFAGPVDESLPVEVSATEHWVVITIAQRTFGFWRETMAFGEDGQTIGLFEADEQGAMGDDEVKV